MYCEELLVSKSVNNSGTTILYEQRADKGIRRGKAANLDLHREQTRL
jgi:hypothetical protein